MFKIRSIAVRLILAISLTVPSPAASSEPSRSPSNAR
jgi:hypothetical protein